MLEVLPWPALLFASQMLQRALSALILEKRSRAILSTCGPCCLVVVVELTKSRSRAMLHLCKTQKVFSLLLSLTLSHSQEDAFRYTFFCGFFFFFVVPKCGTA